MAKHSIKARVLGAAFSAALVASLAVAPLALGIEGDSPVPPSGAQGTLTVFEQEGNATTTYKAVQLFKADADAGEAIHICWASEDVKAAVEGAIKANAGEGGYEGTTAQEAAEYISANWGADTGATAIIANATFANALADACDGLTGTTVTAGKEATLPEGFYLVVATNIDGKQDAMGTSPVFVLVDDKAPVTVDPKTSVPTVTKTVTEDSTGTAGATADSAIGQDLDYCITGTVSSNIATFEKYFYEVTDRMTGISLKNDDTSSVVVTVGGVDVTEQLTGDVGSITFADGVLTVTFNDLLGIPSGDAWLPIDASTQIVVTYKAHLTPDAVVGGSGNTNKPTITYSNNPNTGDRGDVTGVETETYVFKLSLMKIDKATGAGLAGAKFTIADQDGLYVQADGTLGEAAYEFESGADGIVAVPGLDEGTYTVRETVAPADYEVLDADIKLVVETSYADGLLSGLTATVSGGEGDAETKVVSVDPELGVVAIQATNDKIVEMPVTGMGGNVVIYVIAGVIIVGAIVALVVRYRRRSGSES